MVVVRRTVADERCAGLGAECGYGVERHVADTIGQA
jgi:hypothetical protein